MYESSETGAYADYEMERGTDQDSGYAESNRQATAIWRQAE